MKISRSLLTLVLVLVTGCIFILAGPGLLSTNAGRSLIIGSLNKKIPGTVRIDSLKLSWFGGQQVQGVTVSDPDGQPVVTLGRLTTEASLLSLARGRLSFGRTEIAGLRAKIVVGPDGATNLKKALSAKKAEKKNSQPSATGITIPVPLSGEMTLVDSSITLSAEGIDPIALQDVKATARLSSIDTPIQVELSARATQADLSGDISLAASLAGFDRHGTLAPDQMDSMITMRATNLPVDGIDRLLNQAGLLRQALGDHLDLAAEVKLTHGAGEAVVKILSPLLTADITATAANGRFSLTRPAAINARLTSGLIEALGKDRGLALAADVPITIEVEELTAPVTGFSPNAVGLKAKLSMGDGMIHATGPMNNLGWRKMALTIEAKNLADALTVKLDGVAEQAGNQGVFHIDTDLTQLFDEQGKLQPEKISTNAKVVLESLPMALFDGLLDQDGLLTTLAGPTLAMELRTKTAGLTAPRGTVSINARAARLTVSGELTVGETVSLTGPAVINLDLTPAAFARLQTAGDRKKSGSSEKKGGTYRLEKNAAITATVRSLRLPRAGKVPDGRTKSGDLALEMDISAQNLFLADSDQTAGFTNLRAEISTDALAQGLDLKISGEVKKTTDIQKGSLTAEGRLGNLLDSAGALSTATMTAALRTEMNSVPMALLDILAGTKGKLAETLGKTMTVTGDTDLNLTRKSGPINFSEQTPYSKAELAALLGDGLLQLERPLSAELEITPALARIVLAKVNPLLARAVSADRPITLRVNKENFQIQVSPYDTAKVQVGQARAEFGTVTLENGGILRGLLALLKTGSGDYLTVQITPIIARIENGVATYERTDFILDNRIKVASWGRVDLVRDQVEMVLGLPAETLGKIFGIYGLAPDYILQIPVDGPTAAPKVNWAAAGREIAVLTARKKLGAKLPGGKLLEGLLGNGTAPPPPTKQGPDQQQQTSPEPQEQTPVQQLLRRLIK